MNKPIKLKQGRTELTTGTITAPGLTFCHIAGTITVTWRSTGLTKVITGVPGHSFDLFEATSVAVTTGTWSFE